MGTEVPGTLFGFSVQVTRMVVHLLKAPRAATVSVEVLDDVATQTAEASVVAEQAKSSLSGNPVADRSIDLWKTLANWSQAVLDNKLDPNKTVFLLRTIQEKKPGEFLAALLRTKNEAEARIEVEGIRQVLWGQPPVFPLRNTVAKKLQPQLTRCFEATWAVLPSVIARLEFECGTGNPITDVKAELGKRIISEAFLDETTRYCLGWVKERVDSCLAEGTPAMVKEEDFRRDLYGFIRKYDRQVLAPFAGAPEKAEIANELRIRTYVQQLELVEADLDTQVRAVTDYLKASIDRSEWAARGEVHSSSITELENDLRQQWGAHKRIIDLSASSLSEHHRGQLLQDHCSTHRAKFQQMEPPPYFTWGSYQALADEKSIGWHPRYLELLKTRPTDVEGEDE